MNPLEKSCPHLSRRGFLGMAGMAATAGALGLSPAGMAAAALDSSTAATPGAAIEPFYGRHQGGILSAQQRSLVFGAFDLSCGQRSEVIALLQRWTAAAARMSRGDSAAPQGTQADGVAADGGSALGLGAARLTITFGFGPGLFERDGVDRYALASRRPAALVDLPKFNGDQLLPEKSGGDLGVQVCADDPQVALYALRQLNRLAQGVAALKWLQTGFASAPRAGGTGRNLMGFKDGSNNPPRDQAAAMERIVWVGDEGGWMKNGSYSVVRRIRIALEHWDNTELEFQQQVVGRQKDNGAPLGQTREFDALDLQARDAHGELLIPANAHARLASAALNDGAQILRRAYSYSDGASFISERWPPWRQGVMLDAGLFFIAYQRDPRSGFIKINQKLAREDIMNQYTTHVGSAIFACPAGVSPGGYIGAALFAA